MDDDRLTKSDMIEMLESIHLELTFISDDVVRKYVQDSLMNIIEKIRTIEDIDE